ncbi:hypothetical protein FHX82_004903 [Amycolatopsis bartoniae]|uniref:Uncharacterized protein n=1 Tax=Amycolatopsis bartoniae TaxID=941986 RepID=A0A8H9IUN4_9PSEU|nr:hypothetical protein [Amycolatopsis bartoniae]MBB2937827.1 hypothetical protein [Amycolatopsis bartoniae]TVT06509.1 hypothetical protein FNH07_19670 [Amycolatopsis bartoniae]GHF41008.1 hypothetical protein GCM10017566_13050 [Amycolatopsis bartoniae]
MIEPIGALPGARRGAPSGRGDRMIGVVGAERFAHSGGKRFLALAGGGGPMIGVVGAERSVPSGRKRFLVCRPEEVTG